MNDKRYDVVVIGAGPAGYPAAIRAAQLGLSAACIDDWQNADGSRTFGGTCLNVGCIPSKALLESSELYHRVHTEFAAHGIKVDGVALELNAMLERKRGIVKQLTSGIEQLFKGAGVTPIKGRGKLLAGNRVEVTLPGGERQVLEAKHVVLATGSTPIELKVAPVDGKRIGDSSGALEFTEVPRRPGVIGAGVIGLELGSVWRRLGAEVVIFEAMDAFLPMADKALAKDFQKLLTKQGMDIRIGAKVAGTEINVREVTVKYNQAGADQRVEVDKVVVAIGRRPY